jgi:flotillin
MDPLIVVVLLIVVAVVAVLLILNLYGRMFRKVGPNQALIVYGAGGQRILTGGGTLVIPLVQESKLFSLELMSFYVAPQQNLYTNQGVSVRVEAVTQLKVRSDRDSILTAAEQFLSKTPQDREGMIRLVMEGHLRGIVGQLTIEQIVKEPEMVSEKMRSTSSADLAKMGLEVVSFTIKEVRDENDYITNMGRPEIERIKKEANIATALAQRDTQIQQASATREAAVAKSNADQARVEAETASETKQAEFQRDLAVKRAEYDAEVKKQEMTAAKASSLQEQVMQQQIVAETAKAQQIDRTAQIGVQQAEATRRQMELEATVIKAAEAEKQRVTALADAERQRMSLEADGRAAALKAQAAAEAEAARVRGAADAEAARLRGMAEADVIRAKGEAEADAMRTKAAAYNEYNQAAVLDKVITNLPEVVRAIAEPLSKVDKISIVSTGGANGSNLGASRVTGDVVNMLAQVPAILEALTGVRMSDLMERVPGLRTVEGSTTSSESGDGSPDGAQAASNGAKEVSPAPTVQRIKVPAPETDPSATTSSQANQANPTNNSTGGASSGPTAGPRKQPVR